MVKPNWKDVGSVQGPRGPKGPAGDDGNDGRDGKDGKDGVNVSNENAIVFSNNLAFMWKEGRIGKDSTSTFSGYISVPTFPGSFNKFAELPFVVATVSDTGGINPSSSYLTGPQIVNQFSTGVQIQVRKDVHEADIENGDELGINVLWIAKVEVG